MARARTPRPTDQPSARSKGKNDTPNWLAGGCVVLIVSVPILVEVIGSRIARIPLYRGATSKLVYLIQDDDLASLRWYTRLGRGLDPPLEPGEGHPVFHTGNPDTLAFLIEAGIDPNARDHEGDTLLQERTRANDLANVERLIAKGVDLDATSREYGTTALEDAIHQEKTEIAALLRRSGARDATVDATRGAPLIDEPSESGGPMALIRRYHRAILEGDRETMARLAPGARKLDPAKEEDWTYSEDWQGVRPVVTHLVEGFTNSRAATVLVCGETRDGWIATWGFQLTRHLVEAGTGEGAELPAEAGAGPTANAATSDGVWVIDSDWWISGAPAERCPAAR